MIGHAVMSAFDPKRTLAACANLPIGCRVPSPGADMKRREFITLVGGAATWPSVARAQLPSSAIPMVTLINARRADRGTALAAEFRKGLSQTGFAEGYNVRVEYHWLDGH